MVRFFPYFGKIFNRLPKTVASLRIGSGLFFFFGGGGGAKCLAFRVGAEMFPAILDTWLNLVHQGSPGTAGLGKL